MWTDKELKELQDEALANRARKWRQEVHMLATNLAPKLVKTGAFPSGVTVDDLVSLSRWKIGVSCCSCGCQTCHEALFVMHDTTKS